LNSYIINFYFYFQNIKKLNLLKIFQKNEFQKSPPKIRKTMSIFKTAGRDMKKVKNIFMVTKQNKLKMEMRA